MKSPIDYIHCLLKNFYSTPTIIDIKPLQKIFVDKIIHKVSFETSWGNIQWILFFLIWFHSIFFYSHLTKANLRINRKIPCEIKKEKKQKYFKNFYSFCLFIHSLLNWIFLSRFTRLKDSNPHKPHRREKSFCLPQKNFLLFIFKQVSSHAHIILWSIL
jgi:hypothetical protein